jgi:hypothetical protein
MHREEIFNCANTLCTENHQRKIKDFNRRWTETKPDIVWMATWCETLGPSHKKECISTDHAEYHTFEEEKTKKINNLRFTLRYIRHQPVMSEICETFFPGVIIWRRLYSLYSLLKNWTWHQLYRRGAELHPQRRKTKREKRQVVALSCLALLAGRQG